MNWIRRVRSRWHERVVTQKLKKTNIARQPGGFERSQHIGLLYEARHPHHLEIVKSFIKKMNTQLKKVEVLAYFDDREDHDHFPYKFFTNKELSWALEPQSDRVRKFMQTPFDLLIGLHEPDCQPLNYVAAFSKAHLRVGPATDQTDCFDIMIESDISVAENPQHFIDQINIYLKSVYDSSFAI